MGLLGKLFKRRPRAKFNVGDIVKCIDDRNHIIVFGKEYKVLSRHQTTCCGLWVYDVGLFCSEHAYCKQCGGQFKLVGRGIHWAGEFRFAKSVGSIVEEAVEEEEGTSVGEESMLEQAKEILASEQVLDSFNIKESIKAIKLVDNIISITSDTSGRYGKMVFKRVVPRVKGDY